MFDVTIDGVPQKLWRYDVDDVPVNGAVDVPPSSNRMFDHEADLDAHHYDRKLILPIGEYLADLFSTDNLSTTITANWYYAFPITFPRAVTVDRIAVHVTGIDAGNFARLGIYADGGAFAPAALVVDGGAVSTGAAVVVAVIVNTPLAAGLYWLVMVADTAVAAFQSTSRQNATSSILGLVSNTFRYVNTVFFIADAYGVLKDPFPAGGALATANMPVIAVRLSSLD